MKTYRIGSGDPGRFKDAFAFVLTEYDVANNKIRLLGARGWKGQEYPDVEAQLAKIHEKHNLDFFIVEQNSTGIHVLESMRKVHNVPVIGITSSNNIKSPKIIREAKTMDKTEHVGWIEEKRQEGVIAFPKKKTPGILTLINQLNTFVRKTTPSRITTYAAEGEQPDDFAMAFMVNTFFIRRRIMRDLRTKKRLIVTKKYHEDDTIDYGTGIPGGSILQGSEILFPQGSALNRKWRIR